MVTDEMTDTYNCLGWSLGIKRWIWPWDPQIRVPKGAFDKLYKGYGFIPTDRGRISVYGFDLSNMRHGCIWTQGSFATPRWESKCGVGIRFRHQLNQMNGGFYGDVLGQYTNPGPIDSGDAIEEEPHATGRSGETFDSMEDGQVTLNPEEKGRVEELAAKVDRNLAAQFSSAYNLWQATWAQPEILYSSNQYDRAKSSEFEALVALGGGVVPLLMEKAGSKGEFFALVALDRLLPQQLRVQFDLEDPHILEGEQGRAEVTIRRWLEQAG